MLLSEAYLPTGNLGDAEAAIQQAYEVDSKNATLRGHVLLVGADVFERQKKWDQAKLAWQAYAEHASKLGADAGVYPQTGAERLKAIRRSSISTRRYAVVRERIAAEKADAGKSAPKKSSAALIARPPPDAFAEAKPGPRAGFHAKAEAWVRPGVALSCRGQSRARGARRRDCVNWTKRAYSSPGGTRPAGMSTMRSMTIACPCTASWEMTTRSPSWSSPSGSDAGIRIDSGSDDLEADLHVGRRAEEERRLPLREASRAGRGASERAT